MSTDTVLSLTNHQSDANFNFKPGREKCYYTISGTTLFPSFSGVYCCSDVFALNDYFGGRQTSVSLTESDHHFHGMLMGCETV